MAGGLRMRIGCTLAGIAAAVAAVVAAPPAGALVLPPSAAIADRAVIEPDTVNRIAAFVVRLSRAPTGDVRIAYRTENETAAAGSDYVARAGTLTIPAGRTVGVIAVGVRGDDIPEYGPDGTARDETFRVRLTQASGATLRDAVAVGTILENDFAFDRFSATAVGHDWTNAYLLSLASHFTYKEELGAATEAQFQERYRRRFGRLGMSGFRFVRRTTPLLNDLEAVAMQNEHALVIAFRGTKEPEDFLTDAVFAQVPIGAGIDVHAGFALSLETAYAELRQIALGAGMRRVWLTGHSLGGALAILLAYRLQSEGIPVQGVVTYGSPRVGDLGFAAAYTALFAGRPAQRWVNANDPVPLLPPEPPYVHVGQYNHTVPVVFANPPRFVVNLDVHAELPVIGDVTMTDHGGRYYAQRIWANAPGRSLLPPPPS